MFICNECGELFEEPIYIKEHHPYGDGYATEEWAVCPYCKENDLDVAERCIQCGEYFADLTSGLCDICYDDMNG